MSNSWQTPLHRAAATTFEELALLVPIDVLDDEQRAAPLAPGMAVDFEGPYCGTLEIHVTENVLPDIAVNMLGAFDTPSADDQRDALGEMANVITGNVLPLLAGSAAVFRLHPPRRVDVRATAPNATVAFGLDGGRAEILLRATEAAA
ncbi:MAG: chemotaxis protein CheX [Gemmatimonadaceae bacterium]|nr:chemotaxis protein CheX [Gemmatimonadaceae bacterium]